MEEILSEIIEIDKNAKKIAKEEKDKKENIDNYIEEEYRTKKTVLDLEYKDELKKQKEKYETELENQKKEIEENTDKEINKIKSEQKLSLGAIIQSIIDKIEEEGE